jgi:uncharacterized membrane protein HdeD (DUF308 family)
MKLPLWRRAASPAFQAKRRKASWPLGIFGAAVFVAGVVLLILGRIDGPAEVGLLIGLAFILIALSYRF